MGEFLLWLGLTLILAVTELLKLTFVALATPTLLAGAIVMVIGIIVYLWKK